MFVLRVFLNFNSVLNSLSHFDRAVPLINVITIIILPVSRPRIDISWCRLNTGEHSTSTHEVSHSQIITPCFPRPFSVIGSVHANWTHTLPDLSAFSTRSSLAAPFYAFGRRLCKCSKSPGESSTYESHGVGSPPVHIDMMFANHGKE